MRLFRRRADPAETALEWGSGAEPRQLDPAPAHLPDPAKPPEARGSWQQAALVNVGITELVKRQIDAQTPPWRK